MNHRKLYHASLVVSAVALTLHFLCYSSTLSGGVCTSSCSSSS
jgi:hypothetical protein